MRSKIFKSLYIVSRCYHWSNMYHAVLQDPSINNVARYYKWYSRKSRHLLDFQWSPSIVLASNNYIDEIALRLHHTVGQPVMQDSKTKLVNLQGNATSSKRRFISIKFVTCQMHEQWELSRLPQTRCQGKCMKRDATIWREKDLGGEREMKRGKGKK